jgi:hypothetical protein
MNVAVFSLTSFEDVQKVFAEAKGHLGEILSAFEFFDRQCVRVMRVSLADTPSLNWSSAIRTMQRGRLRPKESFIASSRRRVATASTTKL